MFINNLAKEYRVKFYNIFHGKFPLPIVLLNTQSGVYQLLQSDIPEQLTTYLIDLSLINWQLEYLFAMPNLFQVHLSVKGVLKYWATVLIKNLLGKNDITH